MPSHLILQDNTFLEKSYILDTSFNTLVLGGKNKMINVFL